MSKGITHYVEDFYAGRALTYLLRCLRTLGAVRWGRTNYYYYYYSTYYYCVP